MAASISSTSGEFDEVIDEQLPLSDQIRVKQWTVNQKQQLEVNVAAGEAGAVTGRDIEELTQNTENLESKLVDVSSIASVKELILQRSQVEQVLLEQLFPPHEQDGSGDSVDGGPKRKIDEDLLKITEKQAKISSEILGHHRKIQETKPELDDLKRKRRDLMIKSRELVYDIKECQERHKNNQYTSLSDDRIKQAKERLDDELGKVIVQRNIIQSLILGSGINWARDPEMKEFLLSLGEPISKLTENL